MANRIVSIILFTLAAFGGSPLFSQDLIGADQPIINGASTFTDPAVVALVNENGVPFCSGTLIGCSTVLTAAHCLCPQEVPGSLCQPGSPLLRNTSETYVFSQNSGFQAVNEILVHPSYTFAVGSDIALLKLSGPIPGVQPSLFNWFAPLGYSLPTRLVGFGNSDGLTGLGTGVKRAGTNFTDSCRGLIPEPAHICFAHPDFPGAPSSNAMTCQGDSGGPALVDLGVGEAVAGISSGGAAGCGPPGAFHTNAYLFRDWIAANVDSVAESTCGGLPSALTLGTEVQVAEGRLTALEPLQSFFFEVGTGVQALGIALNGESANLFGQNNFDLRVNRGAPPDGSNADDCASNLIGTTEFCGTQSPQPGTWWASVRRIAGQGDFQLTVTKYGSTPSCFPDEDTACLLDGKFKVEGVMSSFGNPPEQFETKVMSFPSGRAESDQAVFLESFTPGNFEAGVKMVDACSFPDGNPLRAFWVFVGALTNAETSLRIRDTGTGAVYNWNNPAGKFPQTLGDTAAFPCVPAFGPPACVRDTETACLLDGRFEVTGSMKNFDSPPAEVLARVMDFGQSGRAESSQAVFFESFTPGNFEVGVKMVDACGFPPGSPFRAYWAFYGALTNAQSFITVTQMSSGLNDRWYNPSNVFPFSEGRTQAFPCD